MFTRARNHMAGMARLALRMAGSFVDPFQAARAVAGVPRFVRTRIAYGRASHERIPWSELHPCLSEHSAPAGNLDPHYFYQDIWAAQLVYRSRTERHVDVGSRVDGFVAHCACFTDVEFVDIRALATDVGAIRSRIGSVVDLPFGDGTVHSLSCLHVVEHVGLGRYGDPLDPAGSHRAMKELQRVLAPRGRLYFAAPIGRERVCFNAHRVLSPHTVLAAFDQLTLAGFAAVGDDGRFHPVASPEQFERANYACGLFQFERPA
jgi:SAM-dependent methyltransferase